MLFLDEVLMGGTVWTEALTYELLGSPHFLGVCSGLMWFLVVTVCNMALGNVIVGLFVDQLFRVKLRREKDRLHMRFRPGGDTDIKGMFEQLCSFPTEKPGVLSAREFQDGLLMYPSA